MHGPRVAAGGEGGIFDHGRAAETCLSYSYGTASADERMRSLVHRALGKGGCPVHQTMEGLISVANPLLCERCGRALESDDAVSVIEGVCLSCRTTLRGIVQPLRADQLLAGHRMPDEDDEFLSTPKPRFRLRETAATPSAELNQALSSVTPADVRRSAEPAVTANSTKTDAPSVAQTPPNSTESRTVTKAPETIGPSIPSVAGRSTSLDQTRSFVASAKQVVAPSSSPLSTSADRAAGAAKPELTPPATSNRKSAEPPATPTIPSKPTPVASGTDRTRNATITDQNSNQPPAATPSAETPTSSKPKNGPPIAPTTDQSGRRDRIGAPISPGLLLERRTELRGLPGWIDPSATENAADSPKSDAAPVTSKSSSTASGESRSASVASLGLSPSTPRRPKPRNIEAESAAALAAMTAANGADKKSGTGNLGKQDSDDVVEALESRARVNINRFTPPAPPFSAEGTPKYRRRRRDLFIGTTVGLLLTFSVAYYAIRMQTPNERSPSANGSAAKVSVALAVSPPHAVVKLDGLELGPMDDNGKLNFSLPEGDFEGHFVEVSAPGYHPLKQPVSAFLGAPEAYVSLMRQPYEMRVNTNPPDAQVLIDGELRGASPLTLMMDPTTEPVVVVRRPGYTEHRERVTAPKDGGPLALDYELVPAGQIVSISTDPPNAMIRIDGELKGATPLRIELDPSYLGRRVEIAASMDGYDNSRMQVALPELGGGDVVSAALALKRTLARVNVYTDPPGGRVVVAGKDLGSAPVEVEFRPEETGKTVLVEASMNGTHFGRQEVTIPAAGEPSLLVLPMSFGAQRVIFLLSSPTGTGSDHYALTDQLMQQIHTLTPVQRFSVIATTEDGIETWPGGLDMETATSEQKIRAYDMIRSVRPTRDSTVAAILQASLAFQPTTIWLFVDGELDREVLEQFGESIGDQQISVNIVRASSLDNESWYAEWTTAHRGTLSLLGRDTVPALAVDSMADRD